MKLDEKNQGTVPNQCAKFQKFLQYGSRGCHDGIKIQMMMMMMMMMMNKNRQKHNVCLCSFAA